MYFRKFFKFQVLKPQDVKTKFYNSETDEVFLEAWIQHITVSPVMMEKVIQVAHNVQCNTRTCTPQTQEGVCREVGIIQGVG